jgi:hypothetical protein
MGKQGAGSAFVTVALVVASSASAWAQTGDPQLSTDHPYYPGEGAMSTPTRAVAHALAIPRGSLGSSTNRDKLIRLFLWRAEHYAHLDSPAVYNLPGVAPDPNGGNVLMTEYDSLRAMFSYGFGVCGTNHAQMRAFSDEMGWADRRRGLQGDTGYEIYVDGGWRYVNTDQYTLHFLSNSASDHFASLDQVVSTNHRYIEWNPDLGMGYRLPQANTHGNYADFAGVTGTVANRSLQWRDYYQNVWNIAASSSIKMYGEGYTASPIVYRLRRGESFTRWLQPGGIVSDLGLAGLIWWGYNGGNASGTDNAPYAKYSFVQNAPARDDLPGAPEESAGGQRYGNGCFDWTPNLTNNEHLDGAAAVTGTLVTGGSPALRSTGNSTLVLEHFTPYTIAGRPTDAANPANNAVDGAIVTANTVGTVGVEVSVNAGMTWASVGTLSGAGSQVDFTNTVKGRNQYLLRLSFNDGEGLNSLRVRTITMLSQAVYPNLKDGSTQITYAASNTGAMELSPDLWTSAAADSTTGYVQKIADSGNVTGLYYASGGTFAYQSTNNQPVSLTYQITMPPRLATAGATWKQINAAGCFSVRVPPSGGPYGQIEVAAASTGPWTQIASYSPPSDNELSSYWVYGKSGALSGTTYFVRYTAYNGGYQQNIRYLRLFGTYTLPAAASPTEVTYEWNNGAAQTSTHTVAAGASSGTWAISTGSNVVQKKVTIRIPSGGAPVDSDGDGMTDAFELAHGFNPNNPDEDGNGILDGNDDWDGDGTLNKNDSTPGTVPVPPAPAAPAGGGGGGGGGGCGLLGLEALVLWLFRRLRPLPSWRRKNGRRWVLNA